MTDNEIIKALEICSRRNGDLPCEGCPAYSIAQMCMEDLMSDAFDLINRQKAENAVLKSDLTFKLNDFEHLKQEYEKAETVSIGRKDRLMQKVVELQEVKKENERLLQKLQQAKSEAIKEFAEQLIKRSYLLNGRFVVDVAQINNLVKVRTEVSE